MVAHEANVRISLCCWLLCRLLYIQNCAPVPFLPNLHKTALLVIPSHFQLRYLRAYLRLNPESWLSRKIASWIFCSLSEEFQDSSGHLQYFLYSQAVPASRCFIFWRNFFLPFHGKKYVILHNLDQTLFFIIPTSSRTKFVIFITIQIQNFGKYSKLYFPTRFISVAYIMYLLYSQHFPLSLFFSCIQN